MKKFGIVIAAFCVLTAVHAGPGSPAFPVLEGVYCGYQGWFNAPGDGGIDRGFYHYAMNRQFRPGSCGIDYWPDLSEAGDSETFATPFRHADGSPAHVYSARHPDTVDRHFKWMREYGIQGAFLQRFLTEIRTPSGRENADAVLANVLRAAERHGRAWVLMYDISGHADFELFRRDWTELIDSGTLRRDHPNWQQHKGKPLVALWGLFADRPESLPWFEAALELLQQDPQYGGFAVMAGVNSDWRTVSGDAGERLRAIAARCDILSPWTVGRYNLESYPAWRNRVTAVDMVWCREREILYFPVIFPGFSWHNRKGGPQDQIPRHGGAFYRAQARGAMSLGVKQLYVAMFDEMDEGTCIFKVSPDPPVGESPFLTYGDDPPDHYLKLTREIAEELTTDAASRSF